VGDSEALSWSEGDKGDPWRKEKQTGQCSFPRAGEIGNKHGRKKNQGSRNDPDTEGKKKGRGLKKKPFQGRARWYEVRKRIKVRRSGGSGG